MKNNIDVFYLSCAVPLHVLFVEDGEMDKRVFLATWKDIPSQNEVQFTINNVQHNGGRYINLLITSSVPSQNEVQFIINDVQHNGDECMYLMIAASSSIDCIFDSNFCLIDMQEILCFF